MNINSLNLAMGASYGAYNQKLTQATKTKLDELGILYDDKTTESQGKQLLQKAQAQKETENKNGFLNDNSNSKNNLFEKAQKLAQRLGIEANENMDFQQLISLIEAGLEEKISSNKNNISALKELKNLSQELAFIQAQANGSNGYDAANQALMMSLEMLSQYNKNFL